ncbi:hypothetical protein [Shinella sp. M31]|uniref:hypothetical protein n=1 Tax=Shinella sp. M31 TaxID=3368615 RepID=UPI003B9F43CC
MYKVVKPFPFSEDGFTLVDLNADDERDFGDLAAGLEAEGFIQPAAKKVAVDEQAEPRTKRK